MTRKRKAPSCGNMSRARKRCRAFYSINYSTKAEEKQPSMWLLILWEMFWFCFPFAAIYFFLLIVGWPV